MKTTSFLGSLFPVGCFTALVAGAGLVLAAVVVEKNQVKLEVEGGFRRIVSNGWPDHAPGVFPRRGNPNVISAQHYEFRVPVAPEPGGELRRADGFWWGVAVNGVPFEPGTAETWKNERPSAWRYEAGTGFMDLGLDEHHAHVQPTGAYHYHGRPVGLLEGLGGDGSGMRLVGWAADGFPLYSAMAAEGEPGADGKPGKLRKMTSSYRLKAGKRPAAPDGPGGKYDGRFTEDWEFVRGSGDLDECNGRTGWTPEFPKGTYFYCVTEEFPFLPRFWRGKPDASFSKGGPPPARGGRPNGGGPPGDAPPGGGPPDGGPEGRRPPPPLVSALDLDHSGELDADEISKAPESLKKLDRNGDGRLDFKEMRPPGMERPGPGSGPGPDAGQGPGSGPARSQAPRQGPGAGHGRGPVEPPIDP
ncbi:MAG: hypothetical protein JWL81_1394 [Verrucomicrobiales bacterium]|nr:hypothetical protein [Verrucomicrobiales bacterium]